MATLPSRWRLVPDPALEQHHGHTKGWRRYWSWPSILKTLREFLQPYCYPASPRSGGSVKDEGVWLDSAVAVGIWLAGLPLLLWHGIVELSVIEQQTTLRRNAGDVLVTMVPVDIAPGIDAARTELLGGAVIDAADVEH